MSTPQQARNKLLLGLNPEVAGAASAAQAAAEATAAADATAKANAAIAKAELLAGRTAKPAGMVRMVSIKPSGTLFIYANGSSSHYAVRWWDGTISIAASNTYASKAVPSSGAWSKSAPKEIYAWPCVNGTDASLSLSPFTHFTCDDCGVVSLDVSGLTSLTTLEASYNPLESLDVSTLSSLNSLACGFSDTLTHLDVSGCTALQYLNCSGCIALESLNVSGLPNLNNLYCQDCALTSLDLSGHTYLGEVHCYNNALTSLNVSGLTNLMQLRCYNNPIASLDVSGLTSLSQLYCSQTNITSLSLSGLVYLSYLSCSQTNLASLDASGLTNLGTLDCSQTTYLTSIDLSGCAALHSLYVDNNAALVSLDLSGCTLLEKPTVYDNPLLSSVRAVGCKFGYEYAWSTYNYSAQFTNNALDLDAVWQLLTDMDISDDVDDRINLTGNPCDAGGGPAFDETGQTHTAAEVLALMDAKDYDITLTGGTITHA